MRNRGRRRSSSGGRGSRSLGAVAVAAERAGETAPDPRPTHLYWFIDEVLRITPDGEATPFGTIWGDAQAIAGDPQTSDIYFTSAIGVLRISED